MKMGEMRSHNVYFRTSGRGRLILTDENYNPLAEDDRYTLHKRSKLFTAEGYVTAEDDQPEFFERNTHEKWSVAPFGVYSDIKNTYDSLARERFEGIYLKAVAYAIADTSGNQAMPDRLVLKRIIHMGDPAMKTVSH